jgi:hypothetical protein
MRGALLVLSSLLSGLAGCNALFGLDETHGGDDDDDIGTIDAGDDGVDANPAKLGLVWGLNLDYVAAATPVHGYEAYAAFGPAAESCAKLVETGGCIAIDCDPAQVPVPAPNTGILFVEGQRLVELDPDPNSGLYPNPSGVDGGFFDPGVTVGVYSNGGSIPALSQNVVAPPLVTISSGLLPSATDAVTVDRQSGIELAWAAPQGGGNLYLIIGDAVGVRVHCTLPLADGSATIPGAALEQLAAGVGSLYSYTTASALTVAGDYQVTVVIAQSLRRSDGDWARGTVNIQ